jgi:hypothetical protein
MSGVLIAACLRQEAPMATMLHSGTPHHYADAGRSARWLNVALGVWLFISAFAWRHTSGARADTWILGILITVFAAGALARPQLRWVTALLAIWLFISSFAMHMRHAALWNNVIVAVIVFIASLIPSIGDTTHTTTGPLSA